MENRMTNMARVNGYSLAQEYRLDWDARTATFVREVVQESRSLSVPTINARRVGETLTIVGELGPANGATFRILPSVEHVIVVSDDGRWFDRDVYENGRFVRTDRRWQAITR
jgi:hypothetical protein